MNPVRALREQAALSQEGLALAAGTSQPTIAAYESGRKSPTFRTIERLAGAVGLGAALQFHRPHTREERRSLALHRVIALRLQKDQAVRARARANLQRMMSQGAGATPLLREWGLILRRPLAGLLPVLTDPGDWACELRHVTPFGGILSARERAEVYRAFAESESEAAGDAA